MYIISSKASNKTTAKTKLRFLTYLVANKDPDVKDKTDTSRSCKTINVD